jgi:DNA-binding transcriptional ArsR family regulator
MPLRAIASKEMASFLNVLAHPHRVRIVEELRDRELDVNGLQTILGVSHSRVSQHLGLLRSHRIVAERREGRHVFYRLVQPKLAIWLLDGFDFLKDEANVLDSVREAVVQSKQVWAGGHPEADPPVPGD